jgi:omega-6 fatty acid desaturase (delta-12 desaturase)
VNRSISIDRNQDCRAAALDLEAQLRRAIPAKCHVRSNRIAAWYVGRTVVCYLVAIAGLLLSNAWWLILVWSLLASACVSGMFVLAHDAAHQALFSSSRANSLAGHLLMLPQLHVFSGWVLGHNRLHHRHTLRRNVDFVWHPLTPEEYLALSRWLRLRHRLEWSVIWWTHMMRQNPPARHHEQVRRDRRFVVITAVLATCSALACGAATTGSMLDAVLIPVKLFVVPWIVFSLLMGWAVYIHHIGPDIAWRTGSVHDNNVTVDTTTILRAPWPLDLIWFNIFLHVPHHLDPRLPCYRLRDAVAELLEQFPGVVIARRMRFRDYWSATRACKLYDFERGQWLRYRDLRALDAAP